jgi:ribokinase
LSGSTFTIAPGGKGANQAVAAARLGADTRFAGAVGKDAFGQMLARRLEDEGVDTRLLSVSEDSSTGAATILIDAEGQNIIAVVAGANGDITPDMATSWEEAVGWADAVLVQLEIRLDTAETVLRLAKTHGKLGVLDAGPAQQLPRNLLEAASVVSPNETEATAITGIAIDSLEHAHKAARKLIDMGARAAVLKLGKWGSLAATSGATHHQPAFVIDPVDTVAAGDAFTAALAIALCRGEAWPSALSCANAAGAVASLCPGAQEAMPTEEQVDRLLLEHEESAQ